MKINYYSDTDSLYIDFGSKPAVTSEEVRDGIVIDLDQNGNVTGLDIQHASEKLDLSFLETTAIPVDRMRLAS